ncbi:MAG TPA: hypothetical protein VN495_01200 [Candidatus Paceibacterota bacterium]|nr:hypothetical protein [Candidatus Paceibacterota bacterium]
MKRETIDAFWFSNWPFHTALVGAVVGLVAVILGSTTIACGGLGTFVVGVILIAAQRRYIRMHAARM